MSAFDFMDFIDFGLIETLYPNNQKKAMMGRGIMDIIRPAQRAYAQPMHNVPIDK